ncbi:tyrosine-type recombinase/integrase [Corynebacterium coyleae]|uniref:tyrosine-type recombinase/integrase n=1 Tax=Corynebacterium coyleae TaxID=53374 RepID=UPI00254E4267|nr:tyrosine-type recombinase/integrase [Corynebacterium coyleae]MDK8241661.1 tyrosine-type recombinase/integrase [Corynebacterium coyleae]
MARRRQWGKITKKRTRYYAEYTGPDSKRHTPGHSFPTRGDAEGWLARERRLIDLDAWQPPTVRAAQQEADGITVGEWMEHYLDILATRVKPSTLQTYRNEVRNRILAPLPPGDGDLRVTRLRNIAVTKLTTADVYQWWDGLQVAYPSARTVNQHAYKRLRAACGEAVRRQMIPVNPVSIPEAGKRVPTVEKYLPEDWELAAILTHMDTPYKPLTSLVLHHGVRIGEALAVELKDVTITPRPVPWLPRVTVGIHQNAQRLQVDGRTRMVVMNTPKTSAGVRTVPIMDTDVPLFLAHIWAHPREATVVLTETGTRSVVLLTTTSTGQMVMDTSYRSILARVKRRAGVSPDIDPHTGRNWLITRLAEQGAHLKEIGALLGQDDVATILDVYMKVRPGRTGELMERVNSTLM